MWLTQEQLLLLIEHLSVLCFLSGMFGAAVWLAFMGVLEMLFERLNHRYPDGPAWLCKLAEKAKAKREGQLRGGDAAGRACETGSGDAA